MEQTEKNSYVFCTALTNEPDSQFLDALAALESSLTERNATKITKPNKTNKRIDWARMPKDVRVLSGGVIFYHDGFGKFRTHPTWLGDVLESIDLIDVFTLAPEHPFIPWGGGKCPVAKGIIVEVKIQVGNRLEKLKGKGGKFNWYRSTNVKANVNINEIIGYRIVGLKKGWSV